MQNEIQETGTGTVRHKLNYSEGAKRKHITPNKRPTMNFGNPNPTPIKRSDTLDMPEIPSKSPSNIEAEQKLNTTAEQKITPIGKRIAIIISAAIAAPISTALAIFGSTTAGLGIYFTLLALVGSPALAIVVSSYVALHMIRGNIPLFFVPIFTTISLQVFGIKKPFGNMDVKPNSPGAGIFVRKATGHALRNTLLSAVGFAFFVLGGSIIAGITTGALWPLTIGLLCFIPTVASSFYIVGPMNIKLTLKIADMLDKSFIGRQINKLVDRYNTTLIGRNLNKLFDNISKNTNALLLAIAKPLTSRVKNGFKNFTENTKLGDKLKPHLNSNNAAWVFAFFAVFGLPVGGVASIAAITGGAITAGPLAGAFWLPTLFSLPLVFTPVFAASATLFASILVANIFFNKFMMKKGFDETLIKPLNGKFMDGFRNMANNKEETPFAAFRFMFTRKDVTLGQRLFVFGLGTLLTFSAVAAMTAMGMLGIIGIYSLPAVVAISTATPIAIWALRIAVPANIAGFWALLGDTGYNKPNQLYQWYQGLSHSGKGTVLSSTAYVLIAAGLYSWGSYTLAPLLAPLLVGTVIISAANFLINRPNSKPAAKAVFFIPAGGTTGQLMDEFGTDVSPLNSAEVSPRGDKTTAASYKRMTGQEEQQRADGTSFIAEEGSNIVTINLNS